MAFNLPPLPFPKEPGTNNPYIATPDEGGGYTVPSGHYFKKKVGDLHLWVPVSESDPLPTDNANIDVALSALRDALLGTGNKTLSDLATALEPLATSEKQAELVSALGVIADAAVSDPAASGTVISLLKGLLSQLQAGSPVSVTESSLPTGAATVAKQEAARVLLDTLSKKDYSTAAKQDALAAVVGALDAAAVSDPAAAGTLVALLKGVLERLQTVEGKIDGITDGTAPAKTQLTGSKVELKKIILSDTSEVAAGGEASIQTVVPDGKIWTIQNVDMVTRPPDNATTGNHRIRIYAGAEISIVRAVYNRRLQYVYGGYLDGSQNLMPIEDAAPKEPLVQALVFKGVKISKNMSLQFRYTNATDVVQTNPRTINLVVLEECITS